MKKKNTNYLQKHFPIIVTCLIVVIAAFTHPSLNSTLLSPYRASLFNRYIKTISIDNPLSAADHWEFREFYSRGNITLASNNPDTVQQVSSQMFHNTADFQPYLLFRSNKITSIEGSIEPLSVPLVIGSNIFEDHEIIAESMYFKLGVNHSSNTALLAQIYTIQDAALANGFLNFALRDEVAAEQLQNKHWLVISEIRLD
jgi:hypothetical protein